MAYTLANKVCPDQTAPDELSDQGLLYSQKTTQCVTRAKWVNPLYAWYYFGHFENLRVLQKIFKTLQIPCHFLRYNVLDAH